MLLSRGYPSEAPTCFLRPDGGLVLNKAHRSVLRDGRVEHAMLTSWSPAAGSSLLALVLALQQEFNAVPPLIGPGPALAAPMAGPAVLPPLQLQQPHAAAAASAWSGGRSAGGGGGGFAPAAGRSPGGYPAPLPAPGPAPPPPPPAVRRDPREEHP